MTNITDKERIGAIVEVFFYCVFAFVASCIALVLYWLLHIFCSLFSYFFFG